ncbi:MAG TPA: hypothetical protein VHC72_18920, partial [Bryobacteraceae bacterium]|nr:hypothetical protein [Bryobacteraceae bacterium]
KLLTSLMIVELGGEEIAVQSARNCSYAAEARATIRKTIKTVIATYCIENHFELLYSDRDFDPFAGHPGLRVA